MKNMIERPFAHCCAEAGGHVEACDCVNKDHGTAWFGGPSLLADEATSQQQEGGDATWCTIAAPTAEAVTSPSSGGEGLATLLDNAASRPRDSDRSPKGEDA